MENNLDRLCRSGSPLLHSTASSPLPVRWHMQRKPDNPQSVSGISPHSVHTLPSPHRSVPFRSAYRYPSVFRSRLFPLPQWLRRIFPAVHSHKPDSTASGSYVTVGSGLCLFPLLRHPYPGGSFSPGFLPIWLPWKLPSHILPLLPAVLS